MAAKLADAAEAPRRPRRRSRRRRRTQSSGRPLKAFRRRPKHPQVTLMTRTLALAAILVTTAVAPAPAGASAAPVEIGLGDQSWNIFGDHYFQALQLKRVRVVTPWNVALSTGDREWLDEYLAGGRLPPPRAPRGLWG